MTKTNAQSLDFDRRVAIQQYGGELNQEVVLAAYTKGGSSDINLDTYKNEVSNYDKVSVAKVTVTQK